MRRKTILVATALMTLVPMQYALGQAASPQVINLSCKGTKGILSHYNEPHEPTEQGMTVNLTNGTVSGGWGPVARITNADDATIDFKGRGPEVMGLNAGPPGTVAVAGHIDRVTGRASVTYITADTALGTVITLYDLTCKATNRQF